MVKFTGGKQTRGFGALFNSMAYVGQNGVKNGCEVTENSPADMDILIASGEVYFASSTVSVLSTSITITANGTSYERIDVARIDSSGVVDVVAGTPASLPLSPEYDPDNYVAVALIEVPANATQIVGTKIIDARTLNTSGGASGTSFTGLSDTPSSMTGQSGKIPIVNSGETALEFIRDSRGQIGEIKDWDKHLGATETIDASTYGSHTYDGVDSYRVGKVFTGQDLIDLGIVEGDVFMYDVEVQAIELDGSYPNSRGAILLSNPSTTTVNAAVSGTSMGSFLIGQDGIWISSPKLQSTSGVSWTAATDFVVAYHRDGINSSNDGYTQFRNFTLYAPILSLDEDFVECNGQILNNVESPLHGVTMPNLNGNGYFLRAGNISGYTGGSENHNHRWFKWGSYDYQYSYDENGSTEIDMINDIVGVGGSSDPWNIRGQEGDLYTENTSTLPPYYSTVKIIKVK